MVPFMDLEARAGGYHVTDTVITDAMNTKMHLYDRTVSESTKKGRLVGIKLCERLH